MRAIGWWKGRLKGRTGVFPSNFVQVVEPGPNTQNPNKLNSPFGSLVSAKNSISSNSLNNINTSNNLANNNNSTSNSNLIMNNAQQQEIVSSNECNIPSSTEDSSAFQKTNNNSSTHSERRPKPLRVIGYGDIFAAGAKARPLPSDPSPVGTSVKTTAMASERLSTASLASTLQKPIPKKPPPPAPVNAGGTNGSPSDQAPALPPKPSNQFNPFMQQQARHQLPSQVNQQRTVIDRVHVIYAYKPSNSDELEMEVGDIIDVLEKNIEDQGWWRGELKGKVGVFPDNFVVSINMPQSTQHQSQTEVPATSSMTSSISYPNMSQTMTSDTSPPRQNGYSNNTSSSPLEPTSPSKLNHITASRAKGPTRRPPKNIMSKRNLNESSSSNESKRELTKPRDDSTNASSLIAFDQANNSTNTNTASLPQNVVYQDVLASLPAQSDQQHQQHSIPPQVKNKLATPSIQAATPIATVATTPTINSTPPPWMVELRKTNAEKKRDPMPVSASSSITPTSVVGPVPVVASVPVVAPDPVLASVSVTNPAPAANLNITENGHDVAPVVNVVKATPLNFSKDEFNELKMEVERLRQDTKIIAELKSTVDIMKIELKACQSATESQRKYIKDLVNNLADERKRIAAMQVEIDRNLK